MNISFLQNQPDQPVTIVRLRAIGHIALLVSAITLAAAMILPLLLDASANNYNRSINMMLLTQDRLPCVMLIIGLLLVTATGITTWFIALYSSFRIAGPLYRFARNIELEINEGPIPIINIRATDQLQAESEALANTVNSLQQHYQKIAEDCDKLCAQLNQTTPDKKRIACGIKGLIQTSSQTKFPR